MNELNRLQSSRSEDDEPAKGFLISSKFNSMNERVDNILTTYQQKELEFLKAEREYRNNEQLLRAEILNLNLEVDSLRAQNNFVNQELGALRVRVVELSKHSDSREV